MRFTMSWPRRHARTVTALAAAGALIGTATAFAPDLSARTLVRQADFGTSFNGTVSSAGSGAPLYVYPGPGTSLDTTLPSVGPSPLPDGTQVQIQCYWTGAAVTGPNGQGSGSTDPYWDQIAAASQDMAAQPAAGTLVTPDAYIQTTAAVNQTVPACADNVPSSSAASTAPSSAGGQGTCVPPGHSGNPCEPQAAQEQASGNWCPSGDPTMPVCSDVGAFQNDLPDDYATAQVAAGDYAIKRQAGSVSTAMIVAGWPDAHNFFQHYLDGSGTDEDFDSTVAYHASPGFAAAVDQTVQHQIVGSAGQQSSFDSGWIDFPPVGTFASAWQNGDWENAVGHAFYRVTGQQQPDLTWTVRLQLTSYYQFRPDVNFSIDPIPIVYGA